MNKYLLLRTEVRIIADALNEPGKALPQRLPSFPGLPFLQLMHKGGF